MSTKRNILKNKKRSRCWRDFALAAQMQGHDVGVDDFETMSTHVFLQIEILESSLVG